MSNNGKKNDSSWNAGPRICVRAYDSFGVRNIIDVSTLQRSIDAPITPSADNENSLIYDGIITPGQTVPNGVDCKEFYRDVSSSLGGFLYATTCLIETVSGDIKKIHNWTPYSLNSDRTDEDELKRLYTNIVAPITTSRGYPNAIFVAFSRCPNLYI